MFKFNKPTLMVICAPTCSGKSYLLDSWSKENIYATLKNRRADPDYYYEPQVYRLISTTTRPPRDGEGDGVDYFFITPQDVKEIGKDGFAELIEFDGTHYGVTKQEFRKGLTSGLTPVAIVEPLGLHQYAKVCKEMGIGFFAVYVNTPLDLRMKRLTLRTALDVRTAVVPFAEDWEPDSLLWANDMLQPIEKVLGRHNRRIISMMTVEKSWYEAYKWDVVVPGDSVSTANALIQEAVDRFNERITYENN